ncbi:MAG: polysaccharide biosynthesis/export family protein [Pseudomonadota bacterium]
MTNQRLVAMLRLFILGVILSGVPQSGAFLAAGTSGSGLYVSGKSQRIQNSAEYWHTVDDGHADGPSLWRFSDSGVSQDSNIYGGNGLTPELLQLGTYALSQSPVPADMILSMKIRSTDNDTLGVMFRYKDAWNYYRFSWDRQRAFRRLVKVQEGRAVLLAEDRVPYDIDTVYDLTVITLAEQITIRIDGADVFSVRDGSFAEGAIALYAWGNAASEFSDIAVSPVIPADQAFDDTAPPRVVIAAPSQEEVFNTTAERMIISGTADDNVSVAEVRWKHASGFSGRASGSDHWSTPPIALEMGANRIDIVAVDAAGNEATAVIDIIRAPEPVLEEAIAANFATVKGTDAGPAAATHVETAPETTITDETVRAPENNQLETAASADSSTVTVASAAPQSAAVPSGGEPLDRTGTADGNEIPIAAAAASDRPTPPVAAPAMPAVGASGGGDAVSAPVAMAPVDENYTVGPGDLLEISLWKDESLSRVVTVLPDGTVGFPLLGALQVSGKTVAEIRQETTARLEQYAPDPVVTVAVQQVNSLVVYVIGRVNRPGHYLLNRTVDVLQALTMAGGLTPFAKETDIKVFRKKNGQNTVFRFNYDEVSSGVKMEQNIELLRGDVVVVP